MEESKITPLNGTSEAAKPTYEELEQALKTGEENFNKLRDQAQKMYNQLQEQNMFNAFKRLDYLFKVVEFAHEFDSEFVTTCVEEIKTTITLPAETTETTTTEESK